MGAALQQQTQQTTKLEHWTDLYFKEKQAGYIAFTTDFRRHYFYGANDLNQLIQQTQGKRKQFISINAFDVDWKQQDFSRKTEDLKQIRNIAIDIDQYKLNLSIDEVLDEIQALIVSNKIPEPNLVLTSRGIQIFYSIDRGASPEMMWLAEYITDQLASKLTHLGADHNAKDMSRVMRVPNSVNERNNAIVKPFIWNDRAYTLQELQSYCRPLERFSGTKGKVIPFNKDPKLMLFYRTNFARRDDLKRLYSLRQGDFTHCRNSFMYMFAYHQSLNLNSAEEVYHSVYDLFISLTTKEPKAEKITDKRINSTVKSAYEDAEKFFESFRNNGNRIIYKNQDGIKKPYKTENIIKMLDITEEEQMKMRSIRNPKIAKQQHANYMRNKRHKEGTTKGTMQEYNETRQQRKQRLTRQAKALREEGYKQREIAEQLGVSTRYIKQILKRGTDM